METVYVFGCGAFYQRNKGKLTESYNIVGLVDNFRKGTLDGYDIITPSELPFNSKVIIMIENISVSCSIALQLLKLHSICCSNILFGCTIYSADYLLRDTEINLCEDETFLLKSSDVQLYLDSPEAFYGYFEYRNNVYDYALCNSKKDIIIDIGLNIGDAAVYFLKKERVKKLYGFEPFIDTYNIAKKNLEMNIADKERYEIYPYGISDKNIVERSIYSPRISRNLSAGTDDSNTINTTLIGENEYRTVKIECRKASNEVEKIIAKNDDCNFILKCDCQGAEYAIFKDLENENLLKCFSYITLETHNGQESIKEILLRNGFNAALHNENEDRGVIYAFKIN